MRSAGPVLVLCAGALALYANAFSGAFQFDDIATILDNPHLADWRTFVGHLDHMVRPVLSLTFLLDRFLYGDAAAGYHGLNLALHLACSLLVYRVLLRAAPKDLPQLPFWTALLFLIHPIQTETVTYISGRASGLMSFWYVLGLLFYIKDAERGKGGLSLTRYTVGTWVCFALALGSKETAVTFPLALLLWDALMRRSNRPALGRAWRSRHLPLWLILSAAGLGAWLHPRYADLAQFSVGLRPLGDQLLSSLHATTYALVLVLCPWLQNFDHDLPVFHSLAQWPLPLDLGIWIGFAGIALLAWSREPIVAFGAGWWVLQLLPAHSLVPRLDLLSERNLYLALIGPCLVTVLLGLRAVRRLTSGGSMEKLSVRALSVAVMLAVVLGLSVLTLQRNVLYRDPVLLWSDAVRKSPGKARPHNNLGHAYAQSGQWDRAIEEFRAAVRLNPDYTLAQDNLRRAYLHHAGRPD
jgi:protein O-mannosyl-transferase